MIKEIILPKEGLQMEEGLLVGWRCAPGDAVTAGEPVAEMETDKVTSEIKAPADGILLKILANEGTSVPVGQIIAWIGDSMDEVAAIPEATPVAAKKEDSPRSEAPGGLAPAPQAGSSGTPIGAAGSGGRIFSSPRARMRAEERDIALDSLRPSGPDGLIIERDVTAAPAAVPTAVAPTGQPLAFDRTRRYIAEKMLESLREKAQTTHTVHCDMSALIAARRAYKERGVQVSYNDLLIKACAFALRLHPELNTTVVGGQMFRHTEANIGLAMATENGLLVPVIRHAHWIGTEAIAAESKRLIEAVRTGTLAPGDTEGGTFTVSNLGMFGLDEFRAVINPPESAILAVGRIADRVVPVGGMIAIRPMCTLVLSYDHCVVDGAPAARFMQSLREICETGADL